MNPLAFVGPALRAVRWALPRAAAVVRRLDPVLDRLAVKAGMSPNKSGLGTLAVAAAGWFGIRPEDANATLLAAADVLTKLAEMSRAGAGLFGG